MKKHIAILLLMMISAATVPAEETQKHNYKPDEGYVPNAETAIRIAEAVWLPIYGERITEKKPSNATLENGIWTVEGTLPPKYTKGGVPVAEISKETGEVLRISHGK